MGTDLSEYREFEKHARIRPAMFLGNNIVVGLIKRLIIDCITLCNTDEIIFEITLLVGSKFSIRLTSKRVLTPFFNSFETEKVDFLHYTSKVLKAIADDLVIVDNKNGSGKTITFSLNESIVRDTTVDYLQLNDELLQIALLYRGIKLVSIDKRRGFTNRMCFHFPEGVLYLFERAIAQALGKPKVKMVFDGELNSNKYQICLGSRTDWYPQSLVASFANEIATVSGGSLVDGVVDGLVSACRKYAKEANANGLDVTRKKLNNGLMLICSVNGSEFTYGGSFKETLESAVVKKDAKSISETLVLDFFRQNPNLALDFLSRFDTANPLNVMY